MVDRRQFLTGVATASAVAIAGCSGGPLSGGGPEAAVEQYLTAAQNGDVESANEVLHPESYQYPVEEGDMENQDDLTVNEVNRVSPRELVEWRIEQYGGSGEEPSEEEIEEQIGTYEEQAEQRIDELGVDDLAWVLVSIEANGEEQETPITTVQDDGDWYVLI